MAKYIFYILLGLFLISKFASTSSCVEGYKAPYTITEAEFCLSEADVKQCKKETGGEHYSCWNDIGGPVANSFRCTTPSKLLRPHSSFTAAKIVRSIKILLPDEKTTSFPFNFNPFKTSYRYYVYTLRRIIV